MLRSQRALDGDLDLSRTDPRLHDILRLGAFQLRALRRVPAYAAVSTSVDLAREAAGEPAARFVNQAMRRLSEAPPADPAAGARPSHPDWLRARWTREYGTEGANALLAWNDRPAPLTLQPARWDLARLHAALRDAGLGVEEAPFGAGVRVRTADRARETLPSALPGFTAGAFLVQDPAQVLVCAFAAVPPGSLVYDACAAPGGKAVALERAGARVVAGDARGDRLPKLLATVRRAGVAIRVVAADLHSAPFAPGSLDAVFVDAPCSATGTMARHPEARWRITAAAIARAAARQRLLLAAAAGLVRPGGVLIYATCSLEPEENAQVVEDFLRTHAAFERSAGPAPGALRTAAGDFMSLPHRDQIDGAYAARLERRR